MSDARIELGDRFTDALEYAARLHARQWRKGTPVPYVAHLLGVASLVLEDGGSEDEAIAALLHDAVEDQGGLPVLEEIRRRFGEPVAETVAACSDAHERIKPPWRERKRSYIEHLATATPEALRVSLADKLYNVRAIVRDYRALGPALWQRFSERDAELQLWYYRSLADAFARLRPGPMAEELCALVEELERLVEQSAVISRQSSDG